MKHKKKKQNQKTSLPDNTAQPFIVHVRELRQRLLYVALAVVGFGVLAYFIQDLIINVLLRPAESQQFIYTTAAGGFNFLVTICVYFGIAASIPLIMYHMFRFLEPVFRHQSKQFIVRCSLLSAVLAMLGGLFGYFVALPAALKFLLHQFRADQIQPLLTIHEYVSFVMIYVLGSALLFQIPLILLFINRITPLKPLKLFGYQRFVITGAFIVAAIITPSGDMINQLIMAVPIIVMYQLGIIGVWLYNHFSNRDRIATLKAQDVVTQNARQRLAAAKITQAPTIETFKPIPKMQSEIAQASPKTKWLDIRPVHRTRVTS